MYTLITGQILIKLKIIKLNGRYGMSVDITAQSLNETKFHTVK